MYIKEAVRDTLQSSTGMSSHLQRSVFRTSGATAALRTSVIITNYCWHIAYKECCNLVDRKRQEFAMEGSTEYRAIPKGIIFADGRGTLGILEAGCGRGG